MIFGDVTLKKVVIAKSSLAALLRTDKVSLAQMVDFVVYIESLALETI